jgi:hypothetical protein
MDFRIYPATKEDAISLAPRLRESDIEEMKAAYGIEPQAALLESLEASDPDMCWVAKLGGVAEVMFGVNEIAADTGGIWMLGSNQIYSNSRDFMRHCRNYRIYMHTRYPYLTNFVDVRHPAALRWMRKLGFEAVQFIPEFGVEKRPFIQYVSGADDV